VANRRTGRGDIQEPTWRVEHRALRAVRKRLGRQVAKYERAIQVAFREVVDALVPRGAPDQQLEAQRARVEAEQRRFLSGGTRTRRVPEARRLVGKTMCC
jgi:hypothetical protein